MPKVLYIFFAVIFLAGFCFMTSAQSYQPPVFVDADRIEKIKATLPVIDRLFKKYAEENHFPAFVYGIVADGKLVHTFSTGYTDVAKKISANSQSAFRIASMTKSVTAMAILKLRDEGRLKLDDPVHLYIPEIKNIKYLTKDAPAITIWHLITHAAGFPEDNPWGDRQLADTDDDLLNIFKKGVAFSNVPGIKYEYSNLGFATLGIVIRNITGQSAQRYITETILKPLGMNDTYWEYDHVQQAKLVQGYALKDDEYIQEPLLHDGSYGVMGGLISSLQDFSKYMAFHLSAWPPGSEAESGPVKRSSVREMHHPWNISTFNPGAKTPNGTLCPLVSAYGYGLAWIKDCKQRVTIVHSGGLPGFGSQWRMLPDYGIGIVSFANLTYAPTGSINAMALDTLLALSGLQPRKLPASKILEQRKNELINILPNWDEPIKNIFADNFFMDNDLIAIKNESVSAFKKAGKIITVGEMVAENQLRGHFILEGEKANIRVSYTLTPEHVPLIQAYHLNLLEKK